MANKNLFRSQSSQGPATDAVNEAGGRAYSLSAKEALAQYAVTGCLNNTFYATDKDQLQAILKLASSVQPEFVAQLAVYSREKGLMKDVPALLCAVLTTTNEGLWLLEKIFDRVIDSPKMLRNFVQIMRSGVVGRKSLGSKPRNLVRDWLDVQDDDALFRGSVGNDPSLADVIKMVHPYPATKSRDALYAYLIGKDKKAKALPPLVKQFEAYKAGKLSEAPNVPFEMLTALPLDTKAWTEIAQKATWTQTRMNLNTFKRHDVLKDSRIVKLIADRLRDKELIKKAKAFPYQLMTAYLNVAADMPKPIVSALQDALEAAVSNVPELPGQIYVCVDVSGSMQDSVTGHRYGATSVVRCVDVAALIAASVVRHNPNTEVVPFHTEVVTDFRLNERDSVITNATKLSSLPSGGTNCSAALRFLNKKNAKGDLVIYVSDNQSWLDHVGEGRDDYYGRSTGTVAEWKKFKARNPGAKLVNIDIAPYATTQTPSDKDVLNVGGWSDQVFNVIKSFVSGKRESWVDVIESVKLGKVK